MKMYLVAIAAMTLVACNDSTKSTSESKSTHADSAHRQDSGRTDHSQMSNDLMNSMSGMEQAMQTMKPTGDMDYDFATMMIQHHQGAIEMAKVEVAKGTDQALKAMAQKMIDAQTSEISTMQGIISRIKVDSSKSDGHDHLGDAMRDMMSKMKGMKMTGNLDKDFAMMMIPHHESAVKMAGDEISHGKNFELKKLAQKMSEDQKQEIAQLQEWLKGK